MKKEKKMTAAQSIMKGLQEVAAYKAGVKTKARVHTPSARAIRQKLAMTQKEFAQTFDIPLPTLQKWERGARMPHGPAGTLLKVIEHDPEAVIRALSA